MKRKAWVIGFSLWLSGAAAIASGVRFGSGAHPDEVRAAKSSADIQKEIDESNKKQQSAQEEKEQLEKEIAAMEKEKKDMLSYIKKLDDKQQELSDKIQENTDDIEKTEKEVRRLRREREKASEEKNRQYDTMKKRIKYMYENGKDGYLEMLMESRSLSELFNRTEYITKVNDYDKSLFENYQKLEDRIQAAENEIRKDLDDLTALRESLQVKKSSMDSLIAKKEQEMKEFQASLAHKNDTLDETEKLIAKQEEELEQLMAAQRAAAEREQRELEKRRSPGDEPSAPSSGGFGWPLTVSGRISSYFGYRSAPTAGASFYHKGIDIAVPVGTGVIASKGGTVITASYSSSAGNYVAISHGGGVYTYYMHCSSLKVRVGQRVSRGQKIALSGNTGISTGPHLHFAVFAGGSYVNPLSYVSR